MNVWTFTFIAIILYMRYLFTYNSGVAIIDQWPDNFNVHIFEFYFRPGFIISEYFFEVLTWRCQNDFVNGDPTYINKKKMETLLTTRYCKWNLLFRLNKFSFLTLHWRQLFQHHKKRSCFSKQEVDRGILDFWWWFPNRPLPEIRDRPFFRV